jgi:hypothetical protein
MIDGVTPFVSATSWLLMRGSDYGGRIGLAARIQAFVDPPSEWDGKLSLCYA